MDQNLREFDHIRLLFILLELEFDGDGWDSSPAFSRAAVVAS